MVTSFDGEYDNTMADLLARRETAFVLWHLTNAELPPRLILGWVQPGTPLTLVGERSLAMRQVPGFDDLWELPAAECNLVDGWVYYYWFEVTAIEATGAPPDRPVERQRITDPLATAVDWRLLSPNPAAAIKFTGGRLVSADVGGEQPSFFGAPLPDVLSPNNRLVIYRLPTAWARPIASGGDEVGVGSFRDVQALIDTTAGGATFSDLEVTRPGRAYLTAELGVNAVELLSADSAYPFAPDFELGFPRTYSWPAPNRDLAELSSACQRAGVRFIAEIAPGRVGADDDDRFQQTYDPVSGVTGWFSPARQLMKTAVDRWIHDFHIDGIRLSCIESHASWDFVKELKDHARLRNHERFAALGLAEKADERFIVLGDGVSHEAFKHYIREALVGRSHEHESDFEATVRRAIDCREFGYKDLTQAVIYLTSQHVEGFRNERLLSYFTNCGVTDAEKRTKLAFACLLTAVGTPMILAGEEFANDRDLPVSFSQLGDDWRERIKTYASRLIHLRTTYDALAVNEVEFIHADFTDGKRVLAWRRGLPGSDSQIVVVANFSDFTTPDAGEPHAEYVVPGWPEAPSHKRWREVPQERWVDEARAGREPLYAWEAKVYALY